MTPSKSPSYGIYFTIWVGLMVLLAAGTWISQLPFSKTAIVLLILSVSLIKAGLVTLFYMHLKFEKVTPLWIVALFPFFLIGLAVLLIVLGTHIG